MEHNVTEVTEIAGDGPSSVAYIVDSVLFFISWIGLAGNSVAMFILTSSVKIRKSKSYVLLMNQCLLDFTTSLLMITYAPLKYLGNWSNMSGRWESILCQVIYSELYVTIPIFSSSYNLVALSVERTISVVWPVVHKVKCTRRLTLIVAITIWVFGFGISTAFGFPVNGINPDKGTCYYWNHFPSRLHSQIFSVIYNGFFSTLPLLMMLTSYAVMYASISSRRMRLGVKLNVAGMLATCVLLFLCCHTLKVTIAMISRFSMTSNINLKSPIFVVGVIMVQLNSIVNPFIYSLQFMDYKKEMRRQWGRIMGGIGAKWGTSRESIYAESTSSNPTNNDK